MKIKQQLLKAMFLLACAVWSMGAMAQENSYNMVIEMTNGTKITIGPNDVRSLTFNNGELVVTGENLQQWMQDVQNQMDATRAEMLQRYYENAERLQIHEDIINVLNKFLDNNVVSADGFCPDSYHPHMIDLGLPSGTKWACCNVGATSPKGYGGYYAWGETEEKDLYGWGSYIHCNGSEDTNHDIGNEISGTQYDVAHVKWGGTWQMPTQVQMEELLDNCRCEYVNIGGVNGMKATGTNGKTIFLPSSDYRSNSGWDDEHRFFPGNMDNYYWTGTLYTRYNNDDGQVSERAGCLEFGDGGLGYDVRGRCVGCPVRPVSE